nr:MAG TPA: hypothetical protein [Caudoviricetes sp.]
MSELDEFGIVRYIIDTGDKVVSILINDIAEELGDEDDTLLMKVKRNKIPIYEELWDADPIQSAEYILVKGIKFYVGTWIIDDYIYFQVDLYTTDSGLVLYLDSDRPDRLYDMDWFIANKCLVGHDGGFLKRNYRMYSRCSINFYGAKKVFPINHSIVHDWYGFQKHLANSYLYPSQKKQGS